MEQKATPKKRTVKKSIDWKLLRKQKLDLLYVINKLEKSSNKKEIKQAESLTGILHLIDAIQYEATEQFTEKQIFGKSF